MAALGGDGLRLLSVSGPEPEPESTALNGAGPGLCCWVSVCSCLSLACSYVGSLYVWKSELPRDHPEVIKRRFTSVLVVSSLSPLCVLLWRELTGLQPGISLFTLMGFRLEGFFPAALLPLLLTMILFLGPLMQLSMDCPWDLANGLKVALGELGARGRRAEGRGALPEPGPWLGSLAAGGALGNPPGLGTMPDGHALAAEPGDRPPDRGAGVPGLHAAHAGPLHGPGPRRLHLPPLLWRWAAWEASSYQLRSSSPTQQSLGRTQLSSSSAQDT
ncbi:CAAX prenyl protease 2 isoform X6 [Notamacropus eugenii]|uniref:CAAX prenyl protease 2 isoform X6 n=1 Tax=Notamacropus eugenii TaxID=9315 RepID=UPI003B6773D9